MHVTSSPEPASAEAEESSQRLEFPELPSSGPPPAGPHDVSLGMEGGHQEEWIEVSVAVGAAHSTLSPSTAGLRESIAAVGAEQEAVVKASIAKLTSAVDVRMTDQTRHMHDIFNATAAAKQAVPVLPNALIQYLASVQQDAARMALPLMPAMTALNAMVSDTNRFLTSPAMLAATQTAADLRSIHQSHKKAMADSEVPRSSRTPAMQEILTLTKG